MTVYYQDEQVQLLLGDSLETLRALPDESVNCCVTSPPYYGLRDCGLRAATSPSPPSGPIWSRSPWSTTPTNGWRTSHEHQDHYRMDPR